MNCEAFWLKELEVEQHEIREVLRCILHTIMFNRALGPVRPKDVESGLFDITYVQCGDSLIEKKIDEKIDNFYHWVEKYPNKKSQVCLSFYETRNKQSLWFSGKTERLNWEKWYICLNVVPTPQFECKPYYGYNADISPEDSSNRKAALEAALREVTLQILQLVNEKKDHIPPVVRGSDVVSFPYEIVIPSSSDSSFGVDMFKRILQTTPPAMLS